MVLCFEVGLICLGGFINVVLLSFLVELDSGTKFLFVGFKFSGCKFLIFKMFIKSLKFWPFCLWIKMFVSQVLGFDASVTFKFFIVNIFTTIY